MSHRAASPWVRGARLAWPLGWLACAQGVDAGADPVDAAQEGPGGAVVDAAGDRKGGSAADTGAAPEASGEAPEGAAGDAGGAIDAGPFTDAAADEGSGATGDAEAGGPAEAGVDGGGDAPVDAPLDAVAVRRVFVSSASYDGALGGHAGADSKCQALANAAALGGTWMAWISDSSSSPGARFSRPPVGYALLDGTPVAPSWAALSSGGPTHAIDLTETGQSLATASATASKTWTATLVSGALGAPSCSDFASNAATVTGEIGHCTGTGTVNWTSAYSAETCNVANHLYCFEQ
jgi:hypothetical protein